jgi:hypothetical protein
MNDGHRAKTIWNARNSLTIEQQEAPAYRLYSLHTYSGNVCIKLLIMMDLRVIKLYVVPPTPIAGPMMLLL